MCFSAIVNQNAKKLSVKYSALIDYTIIEEMFKRRLVDDSIKISKAFEASFDKPDNKEEVKIKKLIAQYREQKSTELEAELFKQKKRLAEAERKLKDKETKKALDEQRISTNKIKWHLKKISDLKRTELKPEDSRLFSMGYAPIIVEEDGERLIKLARYHCRPSGKPPSTDFKFNGLYNARRDNLTNAFWKPLFGHKHAFFVVEIFFENVAKHDYEKRKLKAGEESENIVLKFTPPHEMLVACLYDYWSEKDQNGFFSFAAITAEPTPEVAATGHERLIIALKNRNLDSWLQPSGKTTDELYALLDDPEPLSFEHEMAG